MERKSSSKSANDQRNSQAIDQMRLHMEKAGFAPGSRVAYVRALERFAAKLDRKSLDEAMVADARRYLTRLEQSAPSAAIFTDASASLRFYFEDVRGLAWKPLSPLRLRMIEDMQLFGFSQRTQQSYVRSVEGLARYHGKSPEALGNEQIRKYFVHLTCERKLARPTVTIALCGVKFLYEKTLKRDWSLTGVPVPKRTKQLPVVLSRKEVRDILSRIREVRHRACLTLIYACGLRLGEACCMEVSFIDRQRGLVQVCGGKGFKDRYFGLHHSSKRPTLRLLQAAMALQANRPMPEPPPDPEPLRPACPQCQAPMEFERRVQGAKPVYGHQHHTQRGPP